MSIFGDGDSPTGGGFEGEGLIDKFGRIKKGRRQQRRGGYDNDDSNDDGNIMEEDKIEEQGGEEDEEVIIIDTRANPKNKERSEDPFDRINMVNDAGVGVDNPNYTDFIIDELNRNEGLDDDDIKFRDGVGVELQYLAYYDREMMDALQKGKHNLEVLLTAPGQALYKVEGRQTVATKLQDVLTRIRLDAADSVARYVGYVDKFAEQSSPEHQQAMKDLNALIVPVDKLQTGIATKKLALSLQHLLSRDKGEARHPLKKLNTIIDAINQDLTTFRKRADVSTAMGGELLGRVLNMYLAKKNGQREATVDHEINQFNDVMKDVADKTEHMQQNPSVRLLQQMIHVPEAADEELKNAYANAPMQSRPLRETQKFFANLDKKGDLDKHKSRKIATLLEDSQRISDIISVGGSSAQDIDHFCANPDKFVAAANLLGDASSKKVAGLTDDLLQKLQKEGASEFKQLIGGKRQRRDKSPATAVPTITVPVQKQHAFQPMGEEDLVSLHDDGIIQGVAKRRQTTHNLTPDHLASQSSPQAVLDDATDTLNVIHDMKTIFELYDAKDVQKGINTIFKPSHDMHKALTKYNNWAKTQIPIFRQDADKLLTLLSAPGVDNVTKTKQLEWTRHKIEQFDVVTQQIETVGLFFSVMLDQGPAVAAEHISKANKIMDTLIANRNRVREMEEKLAYMAGLNQMETAEFALTSRALTFQESEFRKQIQALDFLGPGRNWSKSRRLNANQPDINLGEDLMHTLVLARNGVFPQERHIVDEQYDDDEQQPFYEAPATDYREENKTEEQKEEEEQEKMQPEDDLPQQHHFSMPSPVELATLLKATIPTQIDIAAKREETLHETLGLQPLLRGTMSVKNKTTHHLSSSSSSVPSEFDDFSWVDSYGSFRDLDSQMNHIDDMASAHVNTGISDERLKNAVRTFMTTTGGIPANVDLTKVVQQQQEIIDEQKAQHASFYKLLNEFQDLGKQQTLTNEQIKYMFKQKQEQEERDHEFAEKLARQFQRQDRPEKEQEETKQPPPPPPRQQQQRMRKVFVHKKNLAKYQTVTPSSENMKDEKKEDEEEEEEDKQKSSSSMQTDFRNEARTGFKLSQTLASQQEYTDIQNEMFAAQDKVIRGNADFIIEREKQRVAAMAKINAQLAGVDPDQADAIFGGVAGNMNKKNSKFNAKKPSASKKEANSLGTYGLGDLLDDPEFAQKTGEPYVDYAARLELLQSNRLKGHSLRLKVIADEVNQRVEERKAHKNASAAASDLDLNAEEAKNVRKSRKELSSMRGSNNQFDPESATQHQKEIDRKIEQLRKVQEEERKAYDKKLDSFTQKFTVLEKKEQKSDLLSEAQKQKQLQKDEDNRKKEESKRQKEQDIAEKKHKLEQAELTARLDALEKSRMSKTEHESTSQKFLDQQAALIQQAFDKGADLKASLMKSQAEQLAAIKRDLHDHQASLQKLEQKYMAADSSSDSQRKEFEYYKQELHAQIIVQQQQFESQKELFKAKAKEDNARVIENARQAFVTAKFNADAQGRVEIAKGINQTKENLAKLAADALKEKGQLDRAQAERLAKEAKEQSERQHTERKEAAEAKKVRNETWRLEDTKRQDKRDEDAAKRHDEEKKQREDLGQLDRENKMKGANLKASTSLLISVLNSQSDAAYKNAALKLKKDGGDADRALKENMAKLERDQQWDIEQIKLAAAAEQNEARFLHELRVARDAVADNKKRKEDEFEINNKFEDRKVERAKKARVDNDNADLELIRQKNAIDLQKKEDSAKMKQQREEDKLRKLAMEELRIRNLRDMGATRERAKKRVVDMLKDISNEYIREFDQARVKLLVPDREKPQIVGKIQQVGAALDEMDPIKGEHGRKVKLDQLDQFKVILKEEDDFLAEEQKKVRDFDIKQVLEEIGQKLDFKFENAHMRIDALDIRKRNAISGAIHDIIAAPLAREMQAMDDSDYIPHNTRTVLTAVKQVVEALHEANPGVKQFTNLNSVLARHFDTTHTYSQDLRQVRNAFINDHRVRVYNDVGAQEEKKEETKLKEIVSAAIAKKLDGMGLMNGNQGGGRSMRAFAPENLSRAYKQRYLNERTDQVFGSKQEQQQQHNEKEESKFSYTGTIGSASSVGKGLTKLAEINKAITADEVELLKQVTVDKKSGLAMKVLEDGSTVELTDEEKTVVTRIIIEICLHVYGTYVKAASRKQINDYKKSINDHLKDENDEPQLLPLLKIANTIANKLADGRINKNTVQKYINALAGEQFAKMEEEN